MARCGWCNQTGLSTTTEGTLEVHFMSWAKKTCKGQDNPSLILVRHRAEISAQNLDKATHESRAQAGRSGARTTMRRSDERFEKRALDKAKEKARDRNFITVVRNRKP